MMLTAHTSLRNQDHNLKTWCQEGKSKWQCHTQRVRQNEKKKTFFIEECRKRPRSESFTSSYSLFSFHIPGSNEHTTQDLQIFLPIVLMNLNTTSTFSKHLLGKIKVRIMSSLRFNLSILKRKEKPSRLITCFFKTSVCELFFVQRVT